MKKILESTKKFHNEFTKTVGASLIAAFGLVVGLAWKDVVDSYVIKYVGAVGSGKLLTAIIITIISVAAIMLIGKIVADKQQ